MGRRNLSNFASLSGAMPASFRGVSIGSSGVGIMMVVVVPPSRLVVIEYFVGCVRTS